MNLFAVTGPWASAPCPTSAPMLLVFTSERAARRAAAALGEAMARPHRAPSRTFHERKAVRKAARRLRPAAKRLRRLRAS